ncbi:amino-acid N-acetyltransferase [Trueperella pecoris]|uniref:Amino-acid N-acetyltransferase n=1 Tax=Trueperella pecoris TaxID=2733571 RepID=A0A7M1R595_9ACTO|nr:amino-acid N-acetyltransferase [Trueperella pecoris]QOR48697.1 amino-acid N-acetyltransferase [Trueperella pecoris]
MRPAFHQGRKVIRPATARDVRAIAEIVRPYAHRRILISKDLIDYFEHLQEFVVVEVDGEVVACGALHVFWEDIAEIRTLAVKEDYLGRGLGRAIVAELEARAATLGIRRLFCLTFEVDFFARAGFHPIEGTPVGVDVYQEILRSHDDGTAEFLDLARVKPNTLGNYRMLKEL